MICDQICNICSSSDSKFVTNLWPIILVFKSTNKWPCSSSDSKNPRHFSNAHLENGKVIEIIVEIKKKPQANHYKTNWIFTMTKVKTFESFHMIWVQHIHFFKHIIVWEIQNFLCYIYLTVHQNPPLRILNSFRW